MNSNDNSSRNDDLESFLASWAGCDGGNPLGIWICGIEYGGSLTELNEALAHFREHDRYQALPTGWDATFRAKHPKFTTWSYHQNVAKLMLAFQAERDGNANPIERMRGYHDYMRTSLYTRDGDTFKLNLYPLASPAVDSAEWENLHRKYPQLARKKEYYELCARVRFGFLSRKRKELGPRLIVATGLTFQRAFAKAFGFTGSPENIALKAGTAVRRCALYRDGESSLLVVPFFTSPSGLNSHELLAELGREISARS